MKYLFIFLLFFCFAKNDSIPDHLPWDTIPGGDSTLYGVRFDSIITHDIFLATPNSSGFLARMNMADYLNGDIRISSDYVFSRWTPCDQHIGKTESYRREKMDTSEVKLLVWNGCSLTEIKATKLTGYNLDRSNLYYDRNGNILRPTKTDYSFVYISDSKWIKPSHVIKEL